jgi:RNA polymerase sigma factor (sigma-70 family)
VESLVVRARAGDLHALSKLLTAGFPRLVGYFRASGVGPAEADDLAADTLESLLRHIARLRRAASFEAWFWTIARTRLRTWIRKNRRPKRHEPVPPSPPLPGELVEMADEHAQIRGALRVLSARDRELLWLREVEGLSYEEIATRFQLAAGTVRVACHRARQRLEDAYRGLENQR